MQAWFFVVATPRHNGLVVRPLLTQRPVMSQDNYMPGYPSPDDYEEGNCPHCDGTGIIKHDCGEDTCCCAYQYDDECLHCDGTGSVDYEASEDDYL
jgi:hypothetical protein